MKTIKAYTSYNYNTGRHYYTTFDIVERLYDPEDPYYYEESIRDIQPVTLDIEQGNPKVFNYSYYEVITKDPEGIEHHYPVACYDIYKYKIRQLIDGLDIALYMNTVDFSTQERIFLTPEELKISPYEENLEYLQNKIIEYGKIDPLVLEDILSDADAFIIKNSWKEG